MRINKISQTTPDIYKVDRYLSYYKIKNEHIVIVDDSFSKVFTDNDYDAIKDYILSTWDTICCYNVEDRGDYWEFIEEDIEEDIENTKYDYEPDDVEPTFDAEESVTDAIESVISTEELNYIPYTEYCMGITSIDGKTSSIYEKAIFVTPVDNVIGDDEIIDDLNVRYFPISKYIDSPFDLLCGHTDVIAEMVNDIIDYITEKK